METLIILLQESGGIGSLLPIILIVFVFYFFMIRPQIKKQKEEEGFRSEIKKGDRVVTIGGIHGKINAIKESKIILEISDNTRLTIDKQAISKEKSMCYSNPEKTST
jgi:preprotein translocase subunit YajC